MLFLNVFYNVVDLPSNLRKAKGSSIGFNTILITQFKHMDICTSKQFFPLIWL